MFDVSGICTLLLTLLLCHMMLVSCYLILMVLLLTKLICLFCWPFYRSPSLIYVVVHIESTFSFLHSLSIHINLLFFLGQLTKALHTKDLPKEVATLPNTYRLIQAYRANSSSNRKKLGTRDIAMVKPKGASNRKRKFTQDICKMD